MQEESKSRIEIPEMVIMDIHSKLPVKSLTRFRCVSKHWCSSFQTSCFISKHLDNNVTNNNLNLLLMRRHGNIRDVDINYFSALSIEKRQNFEVKENIHLPFFKDCFYEPKVYGPCNGLLCLSDYGRVALWNPSTREFKIISKSTVPRPTWADFACFDCLGFGYDSRVDDYKVVRFVNCEKKEDENNPSLFSESIHQVELYSLKRNSWKEISAPEHITAHGLNWFNNYVNGFYYWLASGPTIAERLILLTFDMTNENFSTLPLPSSKHSGYPQLLDFNGLLGAIVYQREGTEKSLDLWVMNGSWIKQFSIEPILRVERPLGFWKNGEIFLESSNHELVLYDPSTGEAKNLGIYAYKNTMQLITYVQSLVPINGRSEGEEHIIRQPIGEASNRY